jgi:pyruvate/2-oxoglutarate dehydrogenase complex dihydrolipoamide acyltransferase (E2) component
MKKTEISLQTLKTGANKKFADDTFNLKGLQNYVHTCTDNPDLIELLRRTNTKRTDVNYDFIKAGHLAESLFLFDTNKNVIAKRRLFSINYVTESIKNNFIHKYDPFEQKLKETAFLDELEKYEAKKAAEQAEQEKAEQEKAVEKEKEAAEKEAAAKLVTAAAAKLAAEQAAALKIKQDQYNKQLEIEKAAKLAATAAEKKAIFEAKAAAKEKEIAEKKAAKLAAAAA